MPNQTQPVEEADALNYAPGRDSFILRKDPSPRPRTQSCNWISRRSLNV